MPKNGYVENEDFVPEPTAQYGTLDTSATAGAAHSQIVEISPVFEVADAQNAANAAKALDPDDDSVPASAVILPDSGRSRDDAVEAVKAKAKKAEDVDLTSARQTPAQKEAAESGDEQEAKAVSEGASTNAAGGLDGSGTGTTKVETEKKSSSTKK